MTSKERVLTAINHKQPDKVPIDIGSCNTTGISISALYRLRKYFGLPDKPLEAFEIMQMLGTVDDDVRRLLGGDVVNVNNPTNCVGIPWKGNMKPFPMPDGTPALIHEKNEFDVTDDGKIYLYPQGDRTAQPSLMMPSGSYFFDCIDRAPEFDEEHLTPTEDFKEFFSVYTDEEARWIEAEAKRQNNESGCAVIGLFGKGGLADSAFYPGPAERRPKGIRGFADWNMALLLYPDYVREVFEMQTQNCIQNLEIYKQACGDNIQMIVISGTDFGCQNGLLFSKSIFEELYMPYYRRMNDWVHQNTNWKTWYHTCGGIYDLMDDFVEMGVDIVNPLQLSAAGMDAQKIKDHYGDRLVFWGGGIDTQHMLEKGTPEEIHQQATERLRILGKGGGYIFNTIHNIVGNVPAENIAACFQAAREFTF